MEVHDVVAIHRQTQLAMVEADAGGEGVAQIALPDGPPLVAGPIKSAALPPGHVGEHAKPARPGAGVVLLPDVREVDVPQLILMIERHQQASVPDRNITRHPLYFRTIRPQI